MADIRLPKERTLHLSGEVSQSSIQKITEGIYNISSDDDDLTKLYKHYGLTYERAPIELIIDSYGGGVYPAFGLVGVMQSSNTPITTIATGCAMSAGFIILISGHERYAHRYSTLMYHQLSSGSWGKIEELKEDMQENERLQSLMEDIVLSKTSLSKTFLAQSRKNKTDMYLSADDALKYKCIDVII